MPYIIGSCITISIKTSNSGIDRVVNCSNINPYYGTKFDTKRKVHNAVLNSFKYTNIVKQSLVINETYMLELDNADDKSSYICQYEIWRLI